MLTNYHTHTTFCDGNNSPEEMVLAAIEKGFSALGFSGHAYAPYGLDFCMHQTEDYIKEIKTLKEKYKDKIEIYLGTEEDMFCKADRVRYEYLIGSAHYVFKDGKYYSLDYNREKTEEAIKAFGGDKLALAEEYYKTFCEYIVERNPDIVGHFDIITKFDEIGEPMFSEDKGYQKIALKYLKEAIKSDCIFEVNTGAISRGTRKTPYPSLELLHTLKKENARIILSSDTHSVKTLDCAFRETRELLLDVGFKEQYALLEGKFQKIKL